MTESDEPLSKLDKLAPQPSTTATTVTGATATANIRCFFDDKHPLSAFPFPVYLPIRFVFLSVRSAMQSRHFVKKSVTTTNYNNSNNNNDNWTSLCLSTR